MKELPSVYNPQEFESALYAWWEQEKLFAGTVDPAKESYTIVIPPPNVTGILHMGHALNNTIQDILVRWYRMRGFAALWVPGTDHAGIATQNVVEKALAKENMRRDDIGREKFIERVWGWKEEYGSTIIRQLKRLGCSCDWSRERFTMDKGLSHAVGEVFKRLYEKDLIYRGNYIINWCPRCLTALSDEEASHVDTAGLLYHIKYPVITDGDTSLPDHVVVATTRPETMLGDVAVAIHPEDERYRGLAGKKVRLPLTERELPIITDDVIDRAFGTGVLKVTPAHDPVDFAIGTRHNLEPFNVMHPDGTMNEAAGVFSGMDRFDCRKAVIAALDKQGLMGSIDDHAHAIGHCYRCDTVVEPRLSLQWFVRMKPLAEPALQAARDGTITFHPARWMKVYLEWMENIRDWCISRQIWWGHRIPIWYCTGCCDHDDAASKKGILIAQDMPERCPDCGGTEFEQDPDVLDTWFSSWLWPFSTLGWPHQTGDLKFFYPTNTLVTAQEIIFFWVARMVMSGCEFMGEVPFRDIYIHGTVRDDTGKKMSKSLGNIIDPLEIIEEFGTDALRFSMISITSQGQDVFLSKDKFLIGRNFANKIWNASRFVLMHISTYAGDESFSATDIAPETLADQWILTKLNDSINRVDEALGQFNFNEAAGVLYDFFWHQYCDWYLELIKVVFYADEKSPLQARQAQAACRIALYVLETILRLLHPIIPFITETLWQELKKTGLLTDTVNEISIMTAPWPIGNAAWNSDSAEATMQTVIEAIIAVRTIKSELRLPPAKRPPVVIFTADSIQQQLFATHADYLKQLARVGDVSIITERAKPACSASAVITGGELFVPLEGMIDIAAETARLMKQIDELTAHKAGIEKKLSNKNFMDRAPRDVVAASQTRLAEVTVSLEKLHAFVADLK